MRRPLLLFFLVLLGCGGGGGSVITATVVGRVLDVKTGGPASPQASVGVPSSTSTLTAVADGSFSLNVSSGNSSLLVTSQNGYPNFTFSTTPASGTTDVGDLWIGPEKVTVTGRVVDSSTANPVAGAQVSFAGVKATTIADGTFSLPNVAYSSTTQAAFWGISGDVTATGYFAGNFSAAPNIAAAGVVAVGDILITSSGNNIPPGVPYDILGRVLPIGGSSGTVVTLSLSGSPVRVFNVGADGVYSFWVLPGSYTITYSKGAQSAPQQAADVVQTSSIVHVPDVTLN